jgi:hypothetical protein
MLTRIDRRKFMKQSVVTTAAFAASPASIYERGRESSEIDKAAIRKFASHVHGQVIAPDDPGYASACQELIGNRPQKPGIIVRSAGSNDIVDIVNFPVTMSSPSPYVAAGTDSAWRVAEC